MIFGNIFISGILENSIFLPFFEFKDLNFESKCAGLFSEGNIRLTVLFQNQSHW